MLKMGNIKKVDSIISNKEIAAFSGANPDGDKFPPAAKRGFLFVGKDFLKDFRFDMTVQPGEVIPMPVMSIEEKVFIIESTITDSLERNFPKGKCSERGAALVMQAEIRIALKTILLGDA